MFCWNNNNVYNKEPNLDSALLHLVPTDEFSNFFSIDRQRFLCVAPIYFLFVKSKSNLASELIQFYFILDACVCNKNYFGDRSQYKDECETDVDCLNGGRYIIIFTFDVLAKM